MKLCCKQARNFRNAEPSNSILLATARNSVNWTKRVNVYEMQFSSTRRLRRWPKVIQISSLSEAKMISTFSLDQIPQQLPPFPRTCEITCDVHGGKSARCSGPDGA